MTGKFKSLLAAAVAIISTASAFAGPTLAVSSRGDKTVNFYKVIAGSYLMPSGSVGVDGSPAEMCLSPDQKRLFVSLVDRNSVAVIDTQAQKVVATLSAPGFRNPDGCIVSPDSKTLYSMSIGAGAVFAFSVDSGQMLKKIPVGQEPRRAVFTPDGKQMLVSNAHSNTLTIIDVASGTATGEVKTGDEPRYMAFSPDGKLLAVGIIDDDSVEFFDGKTFQFKQQVATVQSPQGLEFSSDSKRLYVAGKLSDAIGVMNIGKLARLAYTIPVPAGHFGTGDLWGMAMSTDGNYLFTTNLGDDSVSTIDVRAARTNHAYQAGKSPIGAVYINVPSRVSQLSPSARLDYYRSLAQKAVAAVQQNDLATASKLCKMLEQDWDEGSKSIRQQSPALWEQADSAMDDFIHPITRSNGTAPDPAALNAAYQNFLSKLNQIH